MPAQSCLILCNPTDCSPPDSSIHKILQAGTPVWVAISYSRGSSWFRDWTCISCIAGRFFTTEPPGRSIPKTITNPSSIPWSQNTNSTNYKKKKKLKKNCQDKWKRYLPNSLRKKLQELKNNDDENITIEPIEHSKMWNNQYQIREKISKLTISSQETRKKFKLS